MYPTIKEKKGLPFEFSIPYISNKETIKAIEDARNRVGLNEVEDVDQLKKKLDVDC